MAFTQKSSFKHWKIVTINLSLLTLVPLAIYIMMHRLALNTANEGVSGSEFIVIVATPLLYLTFLFVLIDAVVAVIYMKQQKPQGLKKIFSIAVVVLGILLVTYIATGLKDQLLIPS
jgi:hypothetical protein